MTSDIYEQYRKAFYLSCLRRYEEALFVFSDVYADAYNSHNYFLYYLAKSNCISLSQYLKNSYPEDLHDGRLLKPSLQPQILHLFFDFS